MLIITSSHHHIITSSHQNIITSTHPYKVVFIDLDDTIWDFHTNARLALQDMFNDRGLDAYFTDFEQFFSIYAKRNIELWELYAKGEISQEFLSKERFQYPLLKVGIKDDELADEIGKQYLNNLPSKKTLMPYALELLQYLKSKNYPITLISNGFTEVQNRKINSSGLAPFFDYIVLSETAGALKPNKLIFDHALQLNNVTAAEAIMIGDSYTADIIGAQNAGIDQVYYPLHYPENGVKPNCTYMISSLKELIGLL